MKQLNWTETKKKAKTMSIEALVFSTKDCQEAARALDSLGPIVERRMQDLRLLRQRGVGLHDRVALSERPAGEAEGGMRVTATTADGRTIVVPTIHLNGSSKREIQDALEAAYTSLGKAIASMYDISPNGRVRADILAIFEGVDAQ